MSGNSALEKAIADYAKQEVELTMTGLRLAAQDMSKSAEFRSTAARCIGILETVQYLVKELEEAGKSLEAELSN